MLKGFWYVQPHFSPTLKSNQWGWTYQIPIQVPLQSPNLSLSKSFFTSKSCWNSSANSMILTHWSLIESIRPIDPHRKSLTIRNSMSFSETFMDLHGSLEKTPSKLVAQVTSPVFQHLQVEISISEPGPLGHRWRFRQNSSVKMMIEIANFYLWIDGEFTYPKSWVLIYLNIPEYILIYPIPDHE